MQSGHQQYQANTIKNSIVVACNGLIGPANIGALFRLSEAMGVEKVLFDTTINPNSKRMLKTARSTFIRVPYEEDVSLLEKIKVYKDNGYCTLALEITTDSSCIKDVDTESCTKWLVVIGNEKNGIDEAILSALDKEVHLPMFGLNSSMNVVQALGMALYELRRNE